MNFAKMYYFSSAFLVVFCVLLNVVSSIDPPHIIIIVADDMGWNDVSFHGSDQIPTPNIDALAYNGVILNSHYTQPVCTPSRTALLTGRYPMRLGMTAFYRLVREENVYLNILGMQGRPFLPAEPVSLPPGKLMPEYLKDLGYSTYLIGKWHLGYARWNDTPTYRGFDHHFGYYNGFISYYDYLATWTINGEPHTGFDLRRDHEPAWDVQGQYATDVFTQEATNTIQSHDVNKPLFLVVSHLATHAGNDGKLLEAPQETINKFKHVTDSNRRTYAAMMSKMDDSVGAIVEALEQKNMLQNSIILFLSDNGAPTIGVFSNWGSNYPLRGIKNTLFEGGVRSASFIWSPLIVQNARVSNELIHISDWLPTFYSAAGGDISALDLDMDGLDQWSSLVYDLPSPRTDILINIDEKTRNAALRFNNWKLIVGPPDEVKHDGYFGDSGRNVQREILYNTTAVADSPAGKSIAKVSYTPVSEPEYGILRDQATLRCLPEKSKKNPCDPSSGEVCLYDIANDHCEENNLAKYFPTVVRRMKRALVEYRAGLTPQLNQDPDIEKDDPKLFQYTWNPWLDCVDVTCSA